MPEQPLIEGEDFYWEDGKMVFTAAFLLKRGYCCESGCRHCPYGFGPEGLKRKQGEGKSGSPGVSPPAGLRPPSG